MMLQCLWFQGKDGGEKIKNPSFRGAEQLLILSDPSDTIGNLRSA